MKTKFILFCHMTLESYSVLAVFIHVWSEDNEKTANSIVT